MQLLKKLSLALFGATVILAIYFLVFFYCLTPKVALVPLGEVDSSYLFLVENTLEKYYRVKVEVMPTTPLPDYAYYPPRKRYRADKILSEYSLQYFWTHHKVMAITEKDISVTKGGFTDYGILGYPQIRGRASVISTFRCGRKVSERKKKERIAKNALHELGHTFGLHHCDGNTTCFMNDAKGKMSTIDNESMELCEDCQWQIEDVVRGDNEIKKEP